MLLTRLYLRNFRVYEQELDLALPPGLVGIYGPNGAGKSTLLEAITFTLWGKARTGRDEVRSAGVGADCVTEVEFDHEGHLYLVRRTLSGINSTMRAQATCDGLIMAEGATDTRRYVHSVLGMDDAAFKASVFAEQKQLAAFSSQQPADRRKLVLQLLGITPLDGARDAVRRDARDRSAQHDQVRRTLPDLDALRVGVADAAASAEAATAHAAQESTAAGRADADAEAARAAWQRLDVTRQAYDTLVVEGRGARRELDLATERLGRLREEQAGLAGAAADLADAEAGCRHLDADRIRLGAARAVADAARRLDAATLGEPPPLPDPSAAEAAAEEARRCEAEAAGLAGRLQGARAEHARARAEVDRTAALSGGGDCPLCGQALGDAFAAVQAHRDAELRAAADAVDDLEASATAAADAARDRRAGAASAERAATAAARAHDDWTRAAAVHADADAALAVTVAAWLDVAATGSPGGADRSPAGAAGDVPAAAVALIPALAVSVGDGEAAAARAAHLRGRLDRQDALGAEMGSASVALVAAEVAVAALLERVKALGFDRAALDAATAGAAEAAERARVLRDAAHQADIEAAALRSRAEGEARRLADGEAQHATLADLEGEVRHLSRLAVLISEFRNAVVASVGPRLAAQAAELFGELTDNEYDELDVDPDTFELQIRDAGLVYGLDRFSGSEVDLANLALRVAISEHVRFQSGGTVGLLVLDEIFGPLDEDRKARMLQALEQLKGRFRQVLVVTHDASIKEQLPNAIEVVKLPGRRASARLIA